MSIANLKRVQRNVFVPATLSIKRIACQAFASLFVTETRFQMISGWNFDPVIQSKPGITLSDIHHHTRSVQFTNGVAMAKSFLWSRALRLVQEYSHKHSSFDRCIPLPRQSWVLRLCHFHSLFFGTFCCTTVHFFQRNQLYYGDSFILFFLILNVVFKPILYKRVQNHRFF